MVSVLAFLALPLNLWVPKHFCHFLNLQFRIASNADIFSYSFSSYYSLSAFKVGGESMAKLFGSASNGVFSLYMIVMLVCGVRCE